jgi:DNA gyrase/topoisomerase IV subunit B
MEEDLDLLFTENSVTREDIIENVDGHGYDYGQKVIDEIENEYKGLGSAKAEREKEKSMINEQIKTLQVKLRKMKNVKNHRRININTDIASKRKAIKTQIETLKDRLYDITEEEKGSTVTSGTLMEPTLLPK